MAYTPTTWVTGDTITTSKLNKIEQGIVGAGCFLVKYQTNSMALNKTWQEIVDAAKEGKTPILYVEDEIDGTIYNYLHYFTHSYYNEELYGICFKNLVQNQISSFTTSTTNGYPVLKTTPIPA